MCLGVSVHLPHGLGVDNLEEGPSSEAIKHRVVAAVRLHLVAREGALRKRPDVRQPVKPMSCPGSLDRGPPTATKQFASCSPELAHETISLSGVAFFFR